MVKINRKKIETILLVVIASTMILSIKTVNIVNNKQKIQKRIKRAKNPTKDAKDSFCIL